MRLLIASSSTWSARSVSGTRCLRPAFMRLAGTVQIRASRSISRYAASRTSPGRAAVSVMNSKASLTAGVALHPRTVAMAPATSAYGSDRCAVRRLPVRLARKHRPRRIGRIVGPEPLRARPSEYGRDPLAQALRRRRLRVPDRLEHRDHVFGRDVGHADRSQARQNVKPHGFGPVLRVPLALPSASTQIEDLALGFGEGGNPACLPASRLRILTVASFAPILDFGWCRWADSNRRPTDYESVALPTELHRHGRSGRGVYRISRRETVRRTRQAGRDRRTLMTTSTRSTRVPAGRVGSASTTTEPGSTSVSTPVSTS